MPNKIGKIYSEVKSSYLSKLTNEVVAVNGQWSAGVSKEEVNQDNLRDVMEVLNMDSEVIHAESDISLIKMSLVRATRELQ